MIHHLARLLQPYPISSDTLEKLRTVAKINRYSRGICLLQPEQTDSELRFVKQGTVRGYHYEHDEGELRDITTWVASANDFATDMSSFFLRQPTATYIEVLEPTLIVSVSNRALDGLFQGQPDTGLIIRKLMEGHIVHLEQRLRLLQTRDVHKKIDLFYQFYGRSAHHLSQKHIASFLNIHPVTLSKARAERR